MEKILFILVFAVAFMIMAAIVISFLTWISDKTFYYIFGYVIWSVILFFVGVFLYFLKK